MGWESAVIGASGGLMSGLVSAFSASHTASLNAELQRRNAKWSAREMPAYTRYGLEKAGYNPLLGAGVGPGMSTPMNGPSAGDLGVGEVSSALKDALDKKEKEHQQENADKLLDAQLKQIDATIHNINTHSAQRSLENKILQDKIDNPHPLSGKSLNSMASSTAKWIDRKVSRLKHKWNNFKDLYL